MLSKIYSGAVIGVDGVLIEVEVDVASYGFPTFTIVGLPTKAVDEAKHRVKAAITNTNFQMPDSRITVNLAPADLPKEGSSFDLPIAVGILASSGAIDIAQLEKGLFIGELSLDGKVRKVPGVIPVALMAKQKNIKTLFISRENKEEGVLLKGLNVYLISDLAELILHLNGQKILESLKPRPDKEFLEESYDQDFADIKGQEYAKRALEIAASGMHNLHLKGPPGAGKTLLSRAFPAILPPLNHSEKLEVLKIYSASGLINSDRNLSQRPFRSPHHTISRIGLVGGGSSITAGEITLAHRGVLFLDEFSEFPRSILEALRQPMEDGQITISRASGSLTFPCRFVLLAASNPCPCGYLGHPKKNCRCFAGTILKYKKRLSGPILDRIDLHIDVHPVEENKLTSSQEAEPTSAIKERVVKACERQKKRFKNTKIRSNSAMAPKDIRNLVTIDDKANLFLKEAISKLSLSARSYFKVIKIAQTIADLESKDVISGDHIAESLQYRLKEDTF